MNAFFARIRKYSSERVQKLGASISPRKFIALLAIFVGCLAGLAAGLLKDIINFVSKTALDLYPADHYNWALLLLPVVGILLCGIYCRYMVKDDMEFGCERIANDLKNQNYRLPRHLSYAPAIACSLTIGFGGSAGSEGPIAYTGAGIGSNVGKYFGLDDATLRTLVIIGAAAGIAGIFKAPVGGAMFALEVLGMPMRFVTILALMFACVASACTAYAWSGFTIDVAYMPTNFFEPGMTPGVILLGVFCGLYSFYYSMLMRRTEKLFTPMTNPWKRNLLSGAMIGALVFIFPVLYGEGYGVITDIVNGNFTTIMSDTMLFGELTPWTLIAFVAAVILVKSAASAATNAGGGVAGDFAPTLFAGCLAGLLFAYASNYLLDTHLNVANFALFGMAGVMAGAIQAPLMAIFLTEEMVGDFAMFFPLTICALVSFATVRMLNRRLNLPFRPTWLHGLDNLIHKL